MPDAEHLPPAKAPPDKAPTKSGPAVKSAFTPKAPKPKAPKTRASPLTCDRDTGNETCASIELEPSVDTLDFGRVFVGQQTLRTFSVTNPDPQSAIEIDEAKIIQPGFGDFEVHGTTAMVQPRARHNVTVAYRPTGAGPHAGEVEVRGDFGSSPPVALKGIGDETNAAREKRVKSQDDTTHQVKTTPGQTMVPERQRADIAVQAWRDNLNGFTSATAEWTRRNWNDFYGHTGGDFTVAWTEGHLNNILGDALSALAGLIPGHELVSFIASTLSSLLWDAAFTVQGNRETEELVNDKTKEVSRAIDARLGTTAAISRAAMVRTEALRSTALHRIWTATTADQMEEIHTWAARQPIPKPPADSDRTLSKALLRDWALERARGAKGDSSTNHAAYNDVRKAHFALSPGDDFRRRDLFIYQGRHDWNKLALGGIGRVEHALHDSVHRHELQAKAGNLTGERLAAFVAGAFNNQVWSDFDVPDRKTTAAALDVPENKIGNRMSCRMTLRADGESVVASHFYYLGNGVTHAVRAP